MKHIKKAVLFSMLLPVSMAFAADQVATPDVSAKPPHELQKGAEHKGKGPRGFFNKFAEDLNLTPEQKVKVREIHEESRQETDAKIKAILTPEQLQKFEEFKTKGPHGGPKGERPTRPEPQAE